MADPVTKPNPFDKRRTTVAELPPPMEIAPAFRYKHSNVLVPTETERLPAPGKEDFQVRTEFHRMEYIFPWGDRPLNLPLDFVEVPPIGAPFALTSTTLRDGAQEIGVSFTPEQALKVYEAESRLLIAKTEVFMYKEEDLESFYLMKGAGLGTEITSWIRADKNDLKLPVGHGIEETGMLTSCSDYHIAEKFGEKSDHTIKLSKKEVIPYYLDLINAAFAAGLKRVRVHLEDATRADWSGFVIPYLREIAKLSEKRYDESNGESYILVRLCDTMAYGVPDVRASLPVSVPKAVYAAIVYGGIPPEHLEWHGHQDYARGIAAAGAAHDYGCSMINVTSEGIGERLGNIPLASMLGYAIERNILKSEEVDFLYATQLRREFKRWGFPDHRNPLTSKLSAETKAGIHIAVKDKRVYLPCDTQEVYGIRPKSRIDNMSGVTGLMDWMESYLRDRNDDVNLAKATKENSAFRERMKEINNDIIKYYAVVDGKTGRKRLTPLENHEIALFVLPHFSKFAMFILKTEDRAGGLAALTQKIAEKEISMEGVHTLTTKTERGRAYKYELIRVRHRDADTVRKLFKNRKCLIDTDEAWKMLLTGGENGLPIIDLSAKATNNPIELEIKFS